MATPSSESPFIDIPTPQKRKAKKQVRAKDLSTEAQKTRRGDWETGRPGDRNLMLSL
jgi:hypothetical protein